MGRTLPVLALSMAIMAVSIAGCGGANPFASYPIASDDPCGPQRQQLKSFQDYFFSAMIEGAAIGAVVGGITGYVTGQDTKSTLIGAGSGAVVGGVGGYLLAKEKANSDPAAVSNSVYQDVNTENQQIDGVTAAFRAVRDCRVRTARAVKRDYAAKRITNDDAQQQLAKIKGLFMEDIAFADSLGAKMSERGDEYADASKQMVKSDPKAQRELAARRKPKGGAPSDNTGPVALAAVRVRAEPSTSSGQVGSLSAGDAVTTLDQGDTPSDWTPIQLGDGKTGYVSSRLIGSGAAATRSLPTKPDAAGVAELTETNQLKRRGLTNQVAEAKNQANGGTFELNGSISRLPPGWIFRWAA